MSRRSPLRLGNELKGLGGDRHWHTGLSSVPILLADPEV